MSPDHDASTTLDGWREDERVGTRIDRFTVVGLLGRGGWGVVYLADDPLSSDRVALKLIAAHSRAVRERVAREITALDLLNDPGVVRLVGHGAAPDGMWIAMERVDGRPFPGALRSGGWDQLSPTAVALAETIARVHALGLIHRDLKPANVLVRADGRPVVLDFGLAGGEALGEGLTREGVGVGTPRYQSPEQLAGKRADDRADVYALGVMLYEALAGAPPHEGDDVWALHAARVFQSPVPLEQAAAGVPPAVAEVVRRMLGRAPEDRPSAEEVVRALSGRRASAGLMLPRLDGAETVEHVVARLRRGESVDVHGPRRSGRSRLVDDVAERLPGAARAVPAIRPYASLLPAIGPLPDANLASVREEVLTRLARLPGPLLVDDLGAQDPHTRALLARITLPGGVLRVRDAPGAALLTPVTAPVLARLFAGPERILHLRSDAAALLLRRTGGWPGRVADQLQRWLVEARIRRDEEGHFVVDRDTLDALAEEPAAPPIPDRAPPGLDVEQEDLLVAVRIAWPHADEAALGAILARPAWEIEAQAEELVSQGCLLRETTGLTPCVEPATRWTLGRLRAAHAAVAGLLPASEEARLTHRIAAGEAQPLADEMHAGALRRIARGQNGRAISLLWRLRALAPDRPGVAETLVRLLLELRTSDALNQATFVASAQRPDLRALVEAARLARQGDADAVDQVLAAHPPRDAELCMLAHGARFEAARRRPLDEQEGLLRRLPAASHVQSSPHRLARWQNWLGILRYRQKRFAQAAEVHEAAAPLRATLVERLTSEINAARAWMEADALERAAALAERAREAAEEHRLTSLEAQGAWLLRAVANRHGERVPDPGLPAVIARLGDPVLTAQAWMTEAFIAWRGRHHEARGFALAAEGAFEEAHIDLGALHARTLAWSCAADRAPDDLVTALGACPEPVIGLDGLGLIAWTGARITMPDERLDALEHEQGELASPYPRGALATEEALRLVRLSLEHP